MKYINGIRIIKEIFDSYDEYEILPPNGTEMILRLIDDLKYNRNIRQDSIPHFKKVFPHLFESDDNEETKEQIINKIIEKCELIEENIPDKMMLKDQIFLDSALEIKRLIEKLKQ